MFNAPKIEVHLANIHQREAIYHHSLISPTSAGVTAGLGADGYVLAIEAIANRLAT
jgi:3-dehydroquinate dehydratase-2